MRAFKKTNERLDYIEFRQQLLFNNGSVDRVLFEYEITEKEYKKIMDLMDKFRTKIESGEKLSHEEFESNIYKIVPFNDGDYHFCEYLAFAFMEEGRWKEVFSMLYGDLPKYSYLEKDRLGKD